MEKARDTMLKETAKEKQLSWMLKSFLKEEETRLSWTCNAKGEQADEEFAREATQSAQIKSRSPNQFSPSPDSLSTATAKLLDSLSADFSLDGETSLFAHLKPIYSLIQTSPSFPIQTVAHDIFYSDHNLKFNLEHA
ncbi:hypothetical protein F2Q69_00014763 [Brassica cretica]|uniref:Uncharacterized protein n=1 Tax=Brassica cretica TaxID=69181 RepID=A0A8S9R2X8_BRACR|nr:hypothetical protein F2Q69_00014763 [Brassica cretica]